MEQAIINEQEIQNILFKHSGSNQGGLISILEDIQNKYGYLPKDALEVVSNKTGRSMVDLYGVATFYKSFSLSPRGKHFVAVCLGTACHVRSAPMIVEEFERQLNVSAGETTSDQEFTLETVNCLGACALGPIVMVDGHYFSKVDTAKVKRIIKKAKQGLDKVEFKKDERVFSLDVNCPRCNHSLIDGEYLIDEHPSVRFTAFFANKHGWIRLSCLYGSFNIESEHEIPMDTVVNLFCPHCHAELVGASNCVTCSAPMVPMIIKGGGMIQICSRRGCKNHMLDLDGENF
jgi:NADH-quinone oxidoreductase subunit E